MNILIVGSSDTPGNAGTAKANDSPIVTHRDRVLCAAWLYR